jgi:hypothetical protein
MVIAVARKSNVGFVVLFSIKLLNSTVEHCKRIYCYDRHDFISVAISFSRKFRLFSNKPTSLYFYSIIIDIIYIKIN